MEDYNARTSISVKEMFTMKMLKQHSLRLVWLICIALLSSCSLDSGGHSASSETANLRISIPGVEVRSDNSSSVSRSSNIFRSEQNSSVHNRQIKSSVSDQSGSVIPSEIDSIIVDVRNAAGETLASADMLALSGDLLFTIPVGSDYLVRGRAFAGGELLFYGEAELASVSAGEDISVSLTLNDQVSLSFAPPTDVAIGSADTDIDFSLAGLNDLSIRWYVNDVEGGSAEFGAITADGRYSPPASLPTNARIVVTAEPVKAPSFAQSFSFDLVAPAQEGIAPVASAGSDVAVNEGAYVSLSALASSDVDGTIMSYSWARIAGDIVPVVSGADTATLSFTASFVSSNSFVSYRLTVTDNEGATGFDEITVFIINVDQPLSADAGSNQSVTEGVNVSLDASASSDVDNTITTYLWEQLIGSTATLTDSSIASPDFVAPEVSADEDLVFRVTVTNDASLQSSDTVIVRVANAVTVSSKNYFPATADSTPHALWLSDGSEAGTYQIESMSVDVSSFHRNKIVGDDLYFVASTAADGRELWRTDGAVGTAQLMPSADNSAYGALGASASANPGEFFVLGNRLLYGANTSHNGSFYFPEYVSLNTLNDQLDTIFSAGRSTTGNGANNHQGVLNGFVYFNHTVYSPLTVSSLYRTDGISAAQLVHSGFGDYYMHDFVELNGELYFVVGHDQLWKTDGTDSGTTLVKTFSGSVGYFSNFNGENNMLVFNNQLIFVADDGQGRELWRSDGTTLGTVLVSDIDNNVATSTNPHQFIVFDGGLYFFSSEGSSATDGFWRTDGTQAGTVRIASLSVEGDIFWYEGQVTAVPKTVSGLGLFFVANDGVNGAELWVSDGSAGGTHMVKDINGGGSSSPALLRAGDGFLLFTAQDNDGRAKLWRSDGTDAGTLMVKDVCVVCIGNSAFFPLAG